MLKSKDSPLNLNLPATGLAGVGRERASQLARLGITTILDLLLHRPRRYEDRRHLSAISNLVIGAMGSARGRIVAMGVKTFRQRTRSVFELVLDDDTARLHCRWWNQPYLERYYAVDDEVVVCGKLKPGKPMTMDHPETEVLASGEELRIHVDRIVPIYPLTEGLHQRWLRGLIWHALEQFESAVLETWPGLALPDLPGRAQAVRQLHFPDELSQADLARQRLALDELLELQVELQRRRRFLQTQTKGLLCQGDNRLVKPFLGRLGFTLTDAQTRVLRELRAELGGPYPMRRLLQGDVGSGKTVVAGCCALMAMESGFDVALMAPTEILAEQHWNTFSRWFEPLEIGVALRTANRKTSDAFERGSAQQTDLALSGRAAKPSLVVGTHALLAERFAPPRLGLVIIDEQHKFGVTQREQLVRKGHYPHLLVMTATPIPRTLGLTLYGDLDISVIDQAPAGRGRVRTFVRSAAQLPKVYAFIKEKLDEGRQAYLVFARVEETDTASGLKAVTKEWQQLQALFAPKQVGLVHGRLSRDEKEQVMSGFRAGSVSVLVATSVIEVGVDVPNATVMVIENAERFGLAQLHQLRGRIGRGAHESFCILVTGAGTEDAARTQERLGVLASCHDGFAIADADLRLRGPGELLGQNQSGLPPWRFADLNQDRALIDHARNLAVAWVEAEARKQG
jgi:ATP-dependent DNA helicase RecG